MLGILAGSLHSRPNIIMAVAAPGSGGSPSVCEKLATGTSPTETLLDASRMKDRFNITADAMLGRWSIDAEYQPVFWTPTARVKIAVTLRFPGLLVTALKGIVSSARNNHSRRGS